MLKNVLIGLAAVSVFYVAFFKDDDSNKAPVASVEPDYLIPGTKYRKDEFPFDQVKEERLPGNIAGLWRTVDERPDYIYIGMDGVKTRYSLRETGCYTLLGPRQSEVL